MKLNYNLCFILIFLEPIDDITVKKFTTAFNNIFRSPDVVPSFQFNAIFLDDLHDIPETITFLTGPRVCFLKKEITPRSLTFERHNAKMLGVGGQNAKVCYFNAQDLFFSAISTSFCSMKLVLPMIYH